ncbi:hypothetical protein [Arthrobacter alpinus]|uniref:hypothetical protein n=1 Tax=Arthrobacter alpinus TaxID=656366 RepID=UPI0016494D9D|nr:hypothetical protein [Arthrobacter alpinus]
MSKRSKSQLARRNQRRASPGVASTKAVKSEPLRLRTKVFWIISAAIYVASILVPAIMGFGTWMLVDIILVPILALMAFAVILGDQTPDGSILSGGVDSYSGGGDY